MRHIVKGYADTRFGQVHYRRVEGDGPPVILLHRTPSSSACYEKMLLLMAGRCGAIALDTPGFGQSFHPQGSPATQDYAQIFLAAIDALDIDRFHLCAHHTGTHFAAEMAVIAPSRVLTLTLSGVLYSAPEARAETRKYIGNAPPVDADGQHFAKRWKLMRDLMPAGDTALVHAEAMGALASPQGCDQAFDAILAQDFKAVLSQISCPVRIIEALDDPLAPMLGQVRADHPALPVDVIGHAGMAAPEYQAEAFTEKLLAFIRMPHDKTIRGFPMTERRFQLVRSATGFDLEQTLGIVETPGPDEVRIRVRAVSLNRRDISVRDLSYPVGADANFFTPLSDAAGEVVEVGANVTRFRVGDRVCSTFFPGWTDGRLTLSGLFSALGVGGRGVFADHVTLAQGGFAHVPDDWSFEEAACIACAGVTAWSALMTLGKVQRDDWVLVIGTGGVAIFAAQIAAAAGAKVIILSSSDAKIERAKALGAVAGVNYATNPDWPEVVKQISDGGVQHAVELGGDGTLPKTLASMGIGGHVALIGALDGFGGEIPAVALIMGALRVSAVAVGSHADHLALSAFMAQHGIKPVIDRVFDVGDAEAAYAHAAKGAFGKTVIRIGGDGM